MEIGTPTVPGSRPKLRTTTTKQNAATWYAHSLYKQKQGYWLPIRWRNKPRQNSKERRKHESAASPPSSFWIWAPLVATRAWIFKRAPATSSGGTTQIESIPQLHTGIASRCVNIGFGRSILDEQRNEVKLLLRHDHIIFLQIYSYHASLESQNASKQLELSTAIFLNPKILSLASSVLS